MTSEHDGIVLGLHCRQTLAPHLDKDVEELFTVTAQCFDEYHRLFGIRYPFGEYHQAFVPECNAGAMENPGCVTFTDELVFRAQATDSLRANRAMVVAHEMAHQWFGDLVTMTWWDDLWLNESFAEYMGYRTTNNCTRFDDVWVEFAFRTKAWGLAADQRSSSHPIAGNGARDTQQALTEFDGISYSKGAAALRQLNAYLGEESFIVGCRRPSPATLLRQRPARGPDRLVGPGQRQGRLRLDGGVAAHTGRRHTQRGGVRGRVDRGGATPERLSGAGCPSARVHGHGVRRGRASDADARAARG